MMTGEVELEYNSGLAFYTLKGVSLWQEAKDDDTVDDK
jgi:hypothetical protein